MYVILIDKIKFYVHTRQFCQFYNATSTDVVESINKKKKTSLLSWQQTHNILLLHQIAVYDKTNQNVFAVDYILSEKHDNNSIRYYN